MSRNNSPKEEPSTALVPSNHKSFAVATPETAVSLSAEVIGMMDESDFDGFEQPSVRLPYVSIRQKDLKGEKGKLLRPAGGFRMVDKSGVEVDDIDGDQGLIVTILGDRRTRVYFESLTSAQPDCRSLDSLTGVGKPGGDCMKCQLSQWNNQAVKDEDRRPKCASQYNLVCYDWGSQSLYVLNVGRSGLAPWDDFKRSLQRNKVSINNKLMSLPPFALIVKVTTEYRDDKGQYYIPKFTRVKELSVETFKLVKEARETSKELFSRTLEVAHAGDDERSDVNTEKPLDKASELPPDVTPVNDDGTVTFL